jgi:signal transduction histidine kinase/PAS domain-containing protein
VERWPQSLRTAVDVVIGSAFPSIVLWGPDLVEVYNDGYIPVHGAKHPWALGRPTRDVWPEVWHLNEPLFRRALAGETVSVTDAPYALARNGPDAPPADIFATISFSPVHDERGGAGGVLVTMIDTTAEVHARGLRAEQARLVRELEAERARLAEIVRLAPAFMAVLRGPGHVVALTNAGFDAFVGHRDVRGRTVAEALPEAAAQGFVALLDRVLATGEPSVGREVPYRRPDAADAADVRHVDFVCQALTESDGTRSGVFVHGVDVTEQVRARRQVERFLAASERSRVEAEAARERTARLQALTAALSTASTVDEIAAAVVAHATPAFGAVGVVVTRVSPDGGHLEITAARDLPGEVHADWHRFPLDAPVPLAEVARTGRPLFLESREQWTERYPGAGPMLEATGHHANAVAPLVVDGSVVGVLGAAFDAPRAFADDERAFTLAVAQLCAQALERARLFDAERDARADAEHARVEAESANRAKSDFLAVMSHELRTPLNAIGGYAELIEMGIRGPVTVQQREDLRRVQASQRHLLGLINEVLNYAKLETGTVHYEVAEVRVRDALVGAEALVAPQALAKGLALVVAECPPDLAVRADAEKLRQVLVNLLSNAVKFTDRGGRIALACAAAGDRVELTVRDTGLGIAPDQMERIFDPFVQVRADLTRTADGTGLGLAISRDLARGMGGELRVESVRGTGSTFTLALPRA